ncbi:hypothetical protein SCHPADRAFT_905904 [Schizopora paradoxa]|uniref:Uncharacterized protein n=1 Tax=Schizopora paradoxa TaxID=27342 RepID=A0A0H2RQ14_9AGAM|nr:hypothetical protein SCHPADRAFT_905904 [Schizopora paradoxa]
MSDARALLRAKRQEARINHPYASYSSSGQLRCSVCATVVKQASMWEGHIGSKAHRVAVSKLREKELREEEERRAAEKRKAEEEAIASKSKKRRVSEEVEDVEDSRPSKSKSAKGGFPADFFSDPSREIPLSNEDDEEEDDAAVPPVANAEPKSKTQLDLEWDAFQAALQQTPAEEEKEEEQRDAYNRATVAAEPELVSTANEGLPQAAPDPEVAEAEQKEETEEEKRKRKEQEEKELIMDRLIEQERLQEEADLRVNALKAKLEAAKKARSERKKKS